MHGNVCNPESKAAQFVSIVKYALKVERQLLLHLNGE